MSCEEMFFISFRLDILSGMHATGLIILVLAPIQMHTKYALCPLTFIVLKLRCMSARDILLLCFRTFPPFPFVRCQCLHSFAVVFFRHLYHGPFVQASILSVVFLSMCQLITISSHLRFYTFFFRSKIHGFFISLLRISVTFSFRSRVFRFIFIKSLSDCSIYSLIMFSSLRKMPVLLVFKRLFTAP